MPLINKFNYTPLSRITENNKRLYETPDGRKLASVTTILDKTKSEESKLALENWRKSIGEAKAAEVVTEAANRGTRMHKFLETYVLTNVLPEPGSNPYSQQSRLMANTIVTSGLISVDEFWGTEVPLYYPEIYAGTTDCCGIHSGSEAIIDFKQSNKIKKVEYIDDYFLQLLFYGTAHNKIHGTNIKKGVIMMCVKPTEISPGKWDTPVYQEFIISGNEWDRYENKMWNRIEEYYQRF